MHYKRLMFRILLCLLMLMAWPAKASERLLVFAAASQRDVMLEIGELYQQDCDCEVVFSFAATSTLARQIHAGARAGVMISANEAWADWLSARGHVMEGGRAVIAGNRLVLASGAKPSSRFDILKRGRFAMADPQSVPAGIYAREALEALGLWESVRPNAVYSENVRVALAMIERGDLLSGIVYDTDLRLSPQLQAHYVFPETLHSAIRYVALVTGDSDQGRAFVGFLQSRPAQRLFAEYGFTAGMEANR